MSNASAGETAITSAAQSADVDVSVATLAQAPDRIIRLHANSMFAIPLGDQRALHLAAAQALFERQVDTIPIVRRLAAEQGVTRIASLEDLGFLLVPHSASKSYPLSFIENGRFDRLTQWLQEFTAHDLSGIAVRECRTIDAWIDLLDRETPLRLVHSTGTTGKLSFLPRDDAASRQYTPGYERQFDIFGDEKPLLAAHPRDTPLLYLQHRRGAYGQQRLLQALERDYFSNPSMIVAANPDRLSADGVSLGGRLQAAAAKGELGQVEVGGRLAELRDNFIAQREQAGAHLQRFLDILDERFRGAVVSVMGHLPQLYGVSVAALARGMEDIFASGSFVAGGGGLKGQSLPDDWRETVNRFLGRIRPTIGYGMTELVGSFRPCANGRFHLPPWVIPFILDPVSGVQAPRNGVRKGRFGALDLNASSYWGGFISGDEVTLFWGDEAPCGCGRHGAFIEPDIRRYTASEGGDDKITCAGAPQAYDRALDFITNRGLPS
jgi:hypothetical protein